MNLLLKMILCRNIAFEEYLEWIGNILVIYHKTATFDAPAIFASVPERKSVQILAATFFKVIPHPRIAYPLPLGVCAIRHIVVPNHANL